MTGATFVRCENCHTQVELGVDPCPACGKNPEVRPLPAAVPTLFALDDCEQVDGHMFAPGDVFCLHCGAHLSVATLKPCH